MEATQENERARLGDVVRDASEAHYQCGLSRRSRGDLAGAVADFTAALAINPRRADAHNLRGLARLALGDASGAIADADAVLALEPRRGDAYNNRGLARQATGDLVGAINDFNTSIALDPRQADPYHNRGLARQAAGDLMGAVADFDEAIRINPEFCAAYISRASTRYHLGDPGGHVDYDRAFAVDPALASALLVNAILWGLREHPGRDLKNCRIHLQRDPNDGTSYARRGLIQLLEGRDAEAQADFDRYLALRATGRPLLERLIAEARRRGPNGKEPPALALIAAGCYQDRPIDGVDG